MFHAQNRSTFARLLSNLPDLMFEDANAFLMDITREPLFVVTQLVPLLSQVASGHQRTIPVSYGARESSPCLQVFVWSAGASTPIHDHTSWGAYYCLFGSLREERYVRLDDGAQPSTAHLRKDWQRMWRREDGVSTVRPYELGIHRIMNQGDRPAVSVHLYGPRLGTYDGRDYDPVRDFVCDRMEQDESVLPLEKVFSS